MNGVNYLRLSLTDRCNLRCFYCMPKKGISLTPKEDILNFEEITRLISIFASIGIKHLRITGGEPLIRNELDKLIRIISEEIDDVSIQCINCGMVYRLNDKQEKEAIALYDYSKKLKEIDKK